MARRLAGFVTALLVLLLGAAVPAEANNPECGVRPVKVHGATDVLLRCVDADRDVNLVPTVVDAPFNGTLSEYDAAAKKWVFTPEFGFTGLVEFTFFVTDSTGKESEHYLQELHVENAAPTCTEVQQRLRTGKPIYIKLACSDADGDAISAVDVIDPPQHGTLEPFELVGDEWWGLYTPAGEYLGTDAFTVSPADGLGPAGKTPVSLEITVNHPPFCYPLNARPVSEFGWAGFFGTCFDPDAQDGNLEVSVLTPAANGQVQGSHAGDFLDATYTPNLGFSGRDDAVLRLSDGELHADVDLVAHAGSQPFCSATPGIEVRPGGFVSIPITCTSADGLALADSFEMTTPPAKGSAYEWFGSINYTARGEATGADSFTYTVTVGGTEIPVTQPVTIDPAVDRPPRCGEPESFFEIDGPKRRRLDIDCDDPDGDPVTFAVTGDPAHGTVEVIDGRLHYTAEAGYIGPAAFEYTVSDGKGTTLGPYRVTLSIVPPKVPTCEAVDARQVRPGRTDTFELACDDPYNGGLTYDIVAGPAAGELTQPLGSTNPRLRYTAGGTEGADGFTVRARSAVGPSADVVVDVNVSEAANRAPECTGNEPWWPQRVLSGGVTVLDVAATCKDPDGDPLEFVRVLDTDTGTVDPGPAPVLSFHGAENDLGTRSFTYVAQDSLGATSGEATYWLDVRPSLLPACDPPQPITVRPGGSRIVGTPCVDWFGEPLIYEVVDAPALGTLSPAGPSYVGQRRFTAGAVSGTTVFRYRATSATGASEVFEQPIEVTPDANAAPACSGDYAEPVLVAAGKASPLEIRGVACTDPDGDAVGFSADDPANGSVEVVDGKVLYTPDDGFMGDDAVAVYPTDGTATAAWPLFVPVTVVPDQGPTCGWPAPISVRPGEVRQITIDCADELGRPLEWTLLTDPTAGQLSGQLPAVTYTAPAIEGNDSFTFRVSSGGFDVDFEQVITIDDAANRNPVCQAPLVVQHVPAGHTSELDQLCSDPDGDPLTFVVLEAPSHGTATPVDGGVEYAPAADYAGPEGLVLRALDDHGGASEMIEYRLQVLAAAPPYCQDVDRHDVVAGEGVNVFPICTDDLGAPVTMALSGEPAHGDVTLSEDGQFWRYVADAGYAGADSFAFTPASANGTGAPITVPVNVVAGNRAPVCPAAELVVEAGESSEYTCTDPDGDALEHRLLEAPAHGTLQRPFGQPVTYTPDDGYVGADSFTLEVLDGTTAVYPTVHVDVRDIPNVPPVCTAPPLTEAVAGEPATVKVSCSDADGDALTPQVSGDPAHGTAVAAGLAEGVASFTYTAAADHSGADAFAVRVSDGEDLSEPVVAALDVNRRPVCAPLTDGAIKHHTARELTLSCSDPEGEAVTYRVVTPPAHGDLGALAGEGATRTVTYTPDADYSGPDSFVIDAGDGRDLSAPRTIELTVAPNAAPVCDALPAQQVPFQTAHTTPALSCADGEGDALTLSTAVAPQHGAVSYDQVARTATYTPVAGYSGADSFSFVAADGHGGESAPVAVAVNVLADPNVAPVCQAAAVNVVNHTPKAITVACDDEDGDALTVTKQSEPAHGTVTGAGPNFTYTPQGDYAGADAFTVRASDGKKQSPIVTVSIAVAANQAPVCQAKRAGAAHGGSVTVPLACTDAEGDAVTYEKDSDPAQGTVTVDPQGAARFTAAPGQSGATTFAYRGADGHGGVSQPATVTVTVEAAPAATASPQPSPAPSAQPSPVPTAAPSPAPAAQNLAAVGKALAGAARKSAGKLPKRRPALALGTVTCPQGCRLTFSAKPGKLLTLKPVTVPAGRAAKPKLAVTAAARKKLAKKKKLKLTLVVTITDTAGKPVKQTLKLTLKLARR